LLTNSRSDVFIKPQLQNLSSTTKVNNGFAILIDSKQRLLAVQLAEQGRCTIERRMLSIEAHTYYKFRFLIAGATSLPTHMSHCKQTLLGKSIPPLSAA
jgi:hypothetical protein